MSLARTLDALGEEVNTRWPKINNGGCCVFASLVGTALEKKGIRIKGVVSSYFAETAKPISTARKGVLRQVNNDPKSYTLRAWNDNGVSFGHVGLEFKINGKRMHYDSNGLVPAGGELLGFPIYRGRLTLEEMTILANSNEGWNPQFGRGNIPALKRLITKRLKNVTKVDVKPT